MANAPRSCPHNSGTYDEVVEDGKGNVVKTHHRCNGCNMILSTT